MIENSYILIIEQLTFTLTYYYAWDVIFIAFTYILFNSV
jgi:hypothetical protein